MSHKIIRTDRSNKLLDALNIPRIYQKPNISSINFSVILTSWDKNKAVTPEKQQTWFATWIDKIKKKKQLHSKILIGSRPTDNSAMKIAFTLMLSAMDAGYSAKAFNLGFFQKNFESDEFIKYDFIVLYSLNTCSPDYKIDLVRDLLRKMDNSIVIVVCSSPKFGSEALSVLDYNYSYLNFHFNAYLQVDEIQ